MCTQSLGAYSRKARMLLQRLFFFGKCINFCYGTFLEFRSNMKRTFKNVVNVADWMSRLREEGSLGEVSAETRICENYNWIK